MKGKRCSTEEKSAFAAGRQWEKHWRSDPGGEHLGGDLPLVEEAVRADGSERSQAAEGTGEVPCERLDLARCYALSAEPFAHVCGCFLHRRRGGRVVRARSGDLRQILAGAVATLSTSALKTEGLAGMMMPYHSRIDLAEEEKGSICLCCSEFVAIVRDPDTCPSRLRNTRSSDSASPRWSRTRLCGLSARNSTITSRKPNGASTIVGMASFA